MKSLKFALAGNPNVGKSTVFNALTGLRQHTGNWPGKTVELKEGTFTCGEYEITLVDVPGTYSLEARSAEETVARDYLIDGDADGVIVVCDGGLLERNLILALQVKAICRRMIVCVNLMDEAAKKGISVDCDRLSRLIGCPVVPCAARRKEGLEELKKAITTSREEESPCVGCDGGCNFADRAERIAAECVLCVGNPTERDRRLDRFFTGKYTAYPVMAALLALTFYITIVVSNSISGALSLGLGRLNEGLRKILSRFLPAWGTSLLCDGALGTALTVISVMLPPMAIFFPLFTLLEDSGYLPRAAYNVDRCFKACGSCGKQSLTMMMGFGCNAAGATSCRIIDSPRERLIAVLTNSFVPCNGRFSILLALLAAFSIRLSAVSSAGILLLTTAFCTATTLLVSKLLSVTLLRGEPSAFALELPPYRKPQIVRTLIRSLLDRTTLTLLRAVKSAVPAGALIWIASHMEADGKSLLSGFAAVLDPLGRLAGMDGVLLSAFLFAFPAAELTLPLAAAGYAGGAVVWEEVSAAGIAAAGAWTDKTVLCAVIFTLFHFPCATTLATIRKETGSAKWTTLAALLPTGIGYGLCALVNALFSLFSI